MASVFKRGGKGKWYAAWMNHTGKQKTICTGTTDKTAAERIAKKKEAEAALRRDGVIDAGDDRYMEESRRELNAHLADYTASLTAKNRDADYVRWNESRARALIDNAGPSTSAT